MATQNQSYSPRPPHFMVAMQILYNVNIKGTGTLAQRKAGKSVFAIVALATQALWSCSGQKPASVIM